MILAIETASRDTSVALATDTGDLIAVDAEGGAGERQNATLLPRIEQLLDGQGRGFGELTRIAVGIGPGSFTGLRVGMSLAKGIAHGLGLPIAGVPSLVAWLEAEPEAQAALCRAGARDAYLLVRGEGEARLVPAETALELSRNDTLVAPRELVDAWALERTVGPGRAAVAVARLAAAVAPADLATLEPRYGRPPRGLDATPEGAVRWL